jgi:hypothetical protein
MSVPARLGAFGLVLALAFGGATLAGRALGPVESDPEPAHRTVHVDPSTTAPATTTPNGAAPSTTHPPGHEGQP